MLRKLFRRQADPDVQIEKGLEKTRKGVFLEITRLFDRSDIDAELFEDLEMLLIQADVGWDVSQRLVKELQQRIADERIVNPADAREVLRLEMIQLLELATRNR
ncbi:MAG: signal recognition particle receptor subunit alpha, partial [Thermomicrobiales bacterium]